MLQRSRELLVATFPDEAALRRGVRSVRGRGIRVYDAYGPYPVHGLQESTGARSRLPFATLLGGIVGGAAAVTMQFYISVVDWPLDVGGKPPNSTLAFVPIAFELTILCASLVCVAAFLVRSRLVSGSRPSPVIEGATEDVFALVLRRRDAGGDVAGVERLLNDCGATRVVLERWPR